MLRSFVAAAALAAPVALAAQSSPAQALADAQQLINTGRFDSAIVVLSRALEQQPTLGRGWIALGNAQRGAKRFDAADSAYRKALPTPAAALARQSLLSLYASTHRNDSALAMLGEIRRTGGDMSGTAALADIANLRGDARFAVLFPTRESFASPFVEGTPIVHEWRGERAGDEFGWIARGIGDIDRDGVTDVVVSAPANPPYGKGDGRVYAYSGKSGALLWKVQGDPGSLLGSGLESAGDVDGDGVADVIAGAPGANRAFVYSGKTGKQIYVIKGDSADVDLGTAVAGVGDVDGDGIADFVVAAPSSHGTGRAYVYSGKTGRPILTLDGEKPGDSFGATVGGANGRVIVGAAAGGDAHTGRVYVYDHMKKAPLFVKSADSTGVALGYMFVSVIGDVDGDGVPDIYASDFANTAKGRATGRVYVFSGKTGETIRTFTGDEAGGGFGIGAARVGDVDGDGRADLVVGSWQYSKAAWSGGRVTVLSGADGHALQTITGRVPGETLGFDAVGVGDVNGDGATDYLITSAWSLVNGIRSGRVFIVAGTVVRK